MDFKLFDIQREGIKLVGYHYEVPKAKYVCVLIHGVGEHCGRYHRVADYFEKAGIAIVGFDHRGHGRSEGVRGDCAPRNEVLEDVDKVIEIAKEWYPDSKVILYGHSMGGGILCDYRARGKYRNDVDGYLISSPWLLLVKSFPSPVISVLSLFSKIAPKMQINSSCDEKDLGNLKYVQPYKNDPLVHPYITLRAAVDGFVIGTNITKMKNDYEKTAKGIPTLLMYGSNDKICAPKGALKYIELPYNKEDKAFTYKCWEGYSHEIHNGGENNETGTYPIKKMVEFITSI